MQWLSRYLQGAVRLCGPRCFRQILKETKCGGYHEIQLPSAIQQHILFEGKPNITAEIRRTRRRDKTKTKVEEKGEIKFDQNKPREPKKRNNWKMSHRRMLEEEKCAWQIHSFCLITSTHLCTKLKSTHITVFNCISTEPTLISCMTQSKFLLWYMRGSS